MPENILQLDQTETDNNSISDNDDSIRLGRNKSVKRKNNKKRRRTRTPAKKIILQQSTKIRALKIKEIYELLVSTVNDGRENPLFSEDVYVLHYDEIIECEEIHLLSEFLHIR